MSRRAAPNTNEQISRSGPCESDPSRSDRDRRARIIQSLEKKTNVKVLQISYGIINSYRVRI